MKKVAIYRTSLLPTSETFIRAQALALKGWSPILIGYKTVAGGLDLAGLNVQLVPGMANGRVRAWHTKFCHWQGRPHAPTIRALRSLGVELVHAHFGTDATDIWPSVKAAGLPMLVTLHGYDINIYREWWEAGKGGLRRRNYPRRLLAMAREADVGFIAVSEAIRNRAIEYGIPEDKITVAYIGVDTERFKPGDLPIEQRARRILFVGRMVEKKAPLLMIRAFEKVRSLVPDAELTMIGDGPLLAKAKKLAEAIGVPVQFMGRVAPDNVLQQLQDTRLLCLPSVVAGNGDAEGMPTVVPEALACGLPVVTSANGAVGEAVVDGQTGVVFNENDLLGVQAGIVSLLTDDKEWRKQSGFSRQMAASNYSIADASRMLVKIYETMSLRQGSPNQ